MSSQSDTWCRQSILISAREEGLRLFVSRTLGAGIFVFRPDNRLRATMTGHEDLVTT